MKKVFTVILFCCLTWANAQDIPETFRNPILPGFNPDPSICRVEDDYYLVTSSFAWYPGLPIYHSKDLTNWKLIGHGIKRSDQLDMSSVVEKNGIWAPTIRYHEGVFYIITTCNTCGGNFYITARNPAGPWSDPVWLENAPGIDPSLFWDDDGKCYYTGNRWDIKGDDSWPGKCTIWIQEINLEKQKLVGEPKMLIHGHANNARYAEAPHLYKVKGRYLLMIGEGGTDESHSVTVHHSNSIFGPYVADQINPVLTHRHLGKDYPLQAIGHADLVQTQHGEWWSVVLGKRTVNNKVPLGRETFLCKVDFEGETPIFNAGYGKVLLEQQRPNLPWTPCNEKKVLHHWDKSWYSVRAPQYPFYNVVGNKLEMQLMKESVDSLSAVPILLQRVTDHYFQAMTKLYMETTLANEHAGLILYRTTDNYYFLAKEKSTIALYRKIEGEKQLVEQVPYDKADVYFQLRVTGLDIRFYFGASETQMEPIGKIQDLTALADSPINRFNGLGVGLYASSNNQLSKKKVVYKEFVYGKLKNELKK
ncbi:glycoside hydrolase family 43 protein [Sphingobacterium gobiense]|uniref:Glycoside hydrolase 43 family protein n=1 Tax=Sphingobacterium gobiense TaxID=1382456 RepID=A0A2S9JEK8_9SPHI|nr:glycoside hydrolase family 43 protein [Sphingobacterium gobiense]PRD51343.1 glycoside hydrolase 43 family protein [Sphingobacterium gobiense]